MSERTDGLDQTLKKALRSWQSCSEIAQRTPRLGHLAPATPTPRICFNGEPLVFPSVAASQPERVKSCAMQARNAGLQYTGRSMLASLRSRRVRTPFTPLVNRVD